MKKISVFFLTLFIFSFLFSSSFSGGYEGKIGNFKSLALDGNPIDTFNYQRSQSNGLEFDGRYFYLANNKTNPAYVFKIDYIYGILDSIPMPNLGSIFGIGIVGDNLYISNFTNGTIEKINKNHTPVSTYISPGSNYTRGVTSDGEKLYIASTGGGVSSGFIFVTDTLLNIIDTLHIATIIGWPMDIAYCDIDSTLWVLDGVNEKVYKLDISVDPPAKIDSFPYPEPSNTGEGVAFDGNDIWVTTYLNTYAYRFDVGYAKTRVAYFETQAPWGLASNEDILYNHRIAFHHFIGSEIYLVDLTRFQKCIFASAQPNSFYQALSSDKVRYEDWVRNGGVLQINGATYNSNDWSGVEMPFGFTMHFETKDSVSILKEWHPFLNEFSDENSSTLSGWNHSSHGGLINLPENSYPVILTSDNIDTILFIKRIEKGGIIATTMPFEYAYGYAYSQIGENIDMYWVYGNNPNIMWAVADYNCSQNIIQQIEEYPDFGNIDYFNAALFLPNRVDLSIYDLVYTQPNMNYLEPDSLGDTLLQFVNEGKWVITGTFCWFTSFGCDLRGGIMDTLINPFRPLNGNSHYSYSDLGTYIASHPFMQNVDSLVSYFRDYLVLNAGADSVARFSDGEWLLGYRNLPSPKGGVIGVNIFPADGFVGDEISGDFLPLLHNLFKASELTGIDEISKDGKKIHFVKNVSTITSGIFSISFFENLKENVTLKIYDNNGRVIKSVDYNPNVDRISLDLGKEKISGGVYFFKIESKNNLAKGKFLYLGK